MKKMNLGECIMNRGCFAYYKEGISAAFASLKKSKINYFKYYLFMLASFLGSLLFITSPICSLAKVKMAKFAMDEKEIKVFDSFQPANSPKMWYTSLLTNSIRYILILSGVVLIFLCVIPFCLISMGIPNRSVGVVFMVFFAYIGLFVIEIFVLIATLYLSPVNYVIIMRPEMNVTDVLHSSMATMKKTGKLTLFGIALINNIVIGIFAFFVSLFILIGILMNHPAVLVIMIIFSVFVLFALLLVLPILNLGTHIAEVSLYEDIAEFESKSTPAAQQSEHTSVQEQARNQEEKELTTDELLASLFDESE